MGSAWLNINNCAAGVFGIAAGFVTGFTVSLMGKAPLTQAADEVRTPRANV